MDITERVKAEGVVLPLAVLRIILGSMLLWAFIDKLFGLGLATPEGQGMIDGGSPSHGFLEYSDGTFSGLFQWMSQFSDITDILLMMGLLFIGIGLMLGIATKLSVVSGTAMFFILFLSVFPPSDNPFLDYHLVYIIALWAIWVAGAGDRLGLGKRWRELPIVKRFSILE